MQQKSLSKILMGTAIIGFLGFLSFNEVAQAINCASNGNQVACLSQRECIWQLSPEKPEGYCVENNLHNN